MRRILVLATLLSAAPAALSAQRDARAVRRAVSEWRRGHEHQVLRELADLVAIPNLARDSANIRRNAAALSAMLERRGLSVRLLEEPGMPPAVFGELRSPRATRTIVFYAHYDGQPVDTAQWRAAPWQPVLRDGILERGARDLPWPAAGAAIDPEWRLYGRSASDDKAPIVALLAALDAMRASNVPLSVNLKVYLEGEEEAGSPHLRAALQRHAELLRADAWIFADGPVHQSRRPQLVYGVRGTLGFQLTVYGPLRPLHSGHYGNWAPNPGLLLAQLITSMRDADGRILIAGFYDQVRLVTAAERRAIAAVPSPDEELRAELGLAATEAGNAPLLERLMLPALNVQGIELARVGAGAANVISPSATAAFGVRLVPDMTLERTRELVTAHLARLGWHVVDAEPDLATRRAHPRLVRAAFSDGSYPAQRTALDNPAAEALTRALQPALDQPLLHVPTSGGSLPLYHFVEVLNAPLISLPIVNHDNNQHGANENLRLQNLWDGIELFAVMLARLVLEWRAGC